MSDTVGYQNKWPQWSDKEFELTVNVDLDTYAGYALHLVYADTPDALPIAKYTKVAETNYLTKLVTKSRTSTSSVITMYGQRATSALFKRGEKIDVILFLQKADANYNVTKVPFGDPAEFCTAVKGSASETPDIS